MQRSLRVLPPECDAQCDARSAACGASVASSARECACKCLILSLQCVRHWSVCASLTVCATQSVCASLECVCQLELNACLHEKNKKKKKIECKDSVPL